MQAAHGALPTNPPGAFERRESPRNHPHAAISGIRVRDQMAALLLAEAGDEVIKIQRACERSESVGPNRRQKPNRRRKGREGAK
jgi:hypothetical protein